MNQVDSFKFGIVLKDTIDKLSFLGLANVQDDASSELAGFEISKLLSEQQNLESSYADLIQVRSTLIGISNKKKLIKIQGEIKEVAKNLKESTKKLCRLFKENPDLEKDAIKVKKDRQKLMLELGEIIEQIESEQYDRVKERILSELEEQDQLRKLTAHEKDLILQIKKLQQQKAQEQKEYQLESQEKQKTIQALKDKKVDKENRAYMKSRYDKKEAQALEGTQQRIYTYRENELKNEIERNIKKIETENLVHSQLKIFLQKKEDEMKKRAEEMSNLHDQRKQEIEEEKEKMLKDKERDQEKLYELRSKYDDEMEEKKQKEEEELQAIEEQKQEDLMKIRKDNYIRFIQMEYNAWKEAGGGKKKKKKGGKKK